MIAPALSKEARAIRAGRLGTAIRFAVFATIWRDHDADPYAWSKDAWNAGFRSLGALALLYERHELARLAGILSNPAAGCLANHLEAAE